MSASVIGQLPARAMVRAAALLCLAAFAAVSIASMLSPHDLEMYEGPILAHGLRLTQGLALFGREAVLNEPYTFAPYGPVFYGLVGGLLNIFGLSFWPGRAISALATTGSALMIYRVVFRFSGDRVAALAGSALFVVMPATWAFGAIQRVDALATFGALLVVYLTLMGGDSMRYALLGGIAAGLAAMTKQSTVAALGAAMLWYLMLRRRPAFGALIGGVAGTLVVVWAALWLSGNGDFLFNQGVSARSRYSLKNLVVFARTLAADPATVVAVSFCVVAARNWIIERNPVIGFSLLYTGCAAALNFTTSTRLGSINHFCELTAALALCACLEFSRCLRSTTERAIGSVVIIIGMLATLLIFNIGSVRARWLIPSAKASTHEAIVRTLRQTVPAHEPVAAEYPDLVLRAGRRLFFNDLAAYQVAPEEVSRLWSDALAARRLAAIITVGDSDFPGYSRVPMPAAASPGWATTTQHPGPILYLRQDLFDNIQRTR